MKNELEAALDTLAGKGKGAKGKAPRGLERKKMWDEVRALRKEYDYAFQNSVAALSNAYTGTAKEKAA